MIPSLSSAFILSSLDSGVSPLAFWAPIHPPNYNENNHLFSWQNITKSPLLEIPTPPPFPQDRVHSLYQDPCSRGLGYNLYYLYSYFLLALLSDQALHIVPACHMTGQWIRD